MDPGTDLIRERAGSTPYAELPTFKPSKCPNETQIHLKILARMASNSEASTATPQTETSKSASALSLIYVLTYDAKDWSNGVALQDGSRPGDAPHGRLAEYQSFEFAQAAGTEWAFKQLQDRLDRYSPPLETERDRDAAFDDWSKYESQRVLSWSYTISKDNEKLVVKADERIVSSDGEGEVIGDEGQVGNAGSSKE